MNNQRRFGRGVCAGLSLTIVTWGLASSPEALAQPAPAATPPAAAQPAATQPATPASPAATTQAPASDAKPAAPATKPDPVAAALAKDPGGMTLDEVAKLALKTKPGLRAKQAELQAAAARVDQAYVNYFPRVTLTGSYTRLSEVDVSLPVPKTPAGEPASLGAIIPSGSNNVPIVTAPCPNGAGGNCLYAGEAGNVDRLVVASKSSLSFPLVLDNYSFSAQLLIPVSDYLLRITQGHSAAIHAEKSKKIELEAETLTQAADAKVAYLNWVRAKGQTVVAKEAVAQAKAHTEDVKRLKAVGLASQADVLRVEAQVAAAEQAVVEVEAFASIAEEQVRIGLGLPKDKPLTIGVDVINVTPPAALPELSALQDQALAKRLEIRSLDETELSLKDVESVTRAGYYPRLDVFGDLTIANPNQRYIFAGAVTNTTWAAGVRASWTFNDTFTTIGAAAEAKARVTQIAENKKMLRDGLRLEVAAAYAEIKKSGASIDAATRSLAAAEEGLRVRRELYVQGKATNVEMLDSEAEVTRARLRKLDAQIGLIVAQIKYDHAIGNDVGTHKAPDASTDANADSGAATPDDGAAAKKVTDVAKAAPGPLLPLAK